MKTDIKSQMKAQTAADVLKEMEDKRRARRMEMEILMAKCLHENSVKELALGFLRYAALRKLNGRQFSELHTRNLSGENFDAMVDELVFRR